ncbi:MAG: PorT family protein [Bacteroidales bacterium]|nr:PorT family protein [Bacteroidales bacterium]
MKKRNLLIAVFLLSALLATQTGKSQILISLLLGDKLNSGKIEFGLTGGYGLTNMRGDSGPDHLNTFFLGFYFDFLLNQDKPWYLYTGVLVKSKVGDAGYSPYSLADPELDSVFTGGSISREIGYFYVPLEIKYRFQNKFFISAGGQVGLRNSATDKFRNSINNDNDLTFEKDIRENIARIDAGISGGLGYKMMKGLGMSIGIRYYYSLVDVIKSKDVNGSPTAFYIHADIPIGLKK